MAQNQEINEDDIIDFYKSKEIISIRKEDLQQPSKEFVIELYMQILEKLNKSINIYQPDILACINKLNDQMEQTYLAINVFHCINFFVSSVGMNDMKMIDILEPKCDRTIRILHSLATFYVRYNVLKDSWFKYKEKYPNIYRERKELEKRNENLKQSIEEKSMLISSLKNESIGMEQEVKSLEETMAVKKRKAEKESNIIAEIKDEIGTLKEKLKLKKLKFNESVTNLKSCSISETFLDFFRELNEVIKLQKQNDGQCEELKEIIKNTSDFDKKIAQIEIEKKNIEESIRSLRTKFDKDNIEIKRREIVHMELVNGLRFASKKNEEISKMKESLMKETDRLKQLENEMETICQQGQDILEKQSSEHQMNPEKILSIIELFEKLFEKLD
ncbi:hypothetical protein DERF_009025 [Dermatophagoides farinae]|uniref:Kinetochore protein Nuf2 N-terminal domain-containing protein n=1 Tax=Dermatophagoides farinae TaxID=6954 RepID=A0A922L0A5_DERFA|nr:hypothetical protein DERF_009025 [Dermatophagoides farinae]